ncbi:MAG: hypothetical protein GY711_28080 [bacterium]|nr:hypothetical protein [bacterium]
MSSISLHQAVKVRHQARTARYHRLHRSRIKQSFTSAYPAAPERVVRDGREQCGY